MVPDVSPDDGVDDALQPEPQFVPPHVRLAVVGTGVVEVVAGTGVVEVVVGTGVVEVVVGTGVVEVVVGTGVVEVVVGTGVVEVVFAMLHAPVKPLNASPLSDVKVILRKPVVDL